MKNVKVVFSILFIFSFFVTYSFSFSEITFHRVGEGNCTTIAVSEKDKPKQYMIVDCGSQEFRKTSHKGTDVLSTNPTPHTEQEILFSTRKKDQAPLARGTFKGTQLNKIATIKHIRAALGEEPEMDDSSIHVKTVVISHPDEDHFKWLPEILKASSEDKVGNIILGGRPEKYLNNTAFREWLEGWLSKPAGKKPHIFFLAVKGFKIDKIKDLEKLKEGEYFLAPSLFSDPTKDHFNLVLTRISDLKQRNSDSNFDEDLKDAFDFGTHTLFQFLTINPVHVPSNIKKESYIRLFYSQEESNDIDNQDSLVIKIKNILTNKSVVLTGDATALTIKKILSNYQQDELKINVLLAAHHGSINWGSNNPELFESFKPDCIVFSNGQHLGFKHPREEAYQNAAKYLPFGKTDQHEITRCNVNKETNEGSYQTYETQRAIFSTFDNGSMQVTLGDSLNNSLLIRGLDLGSSQKEYPLTSAITTTSSLAQIPSAGTSSSSSQKDDIVVKTYSDLRDNDPIYSSPLQQYSTSAYSEHETFQSPSFPISDKKLLFPTLETEKEKHEGPDTKKPKFNPSLIPELTVLQLKAFIEYLESTGVSKTDIQQKLSINPQLLGRIKNANIQRLEKMPAIQEKIMEEYERAFEMWSKLSQGNK